MGLHLGEGRLRHGVAEGEPEDYVGIDVNYAARIAAAGNGGQIVLSHALVDALGGEVGRPQAARRGAQPASTTAFARSRTSRSRAGSTASSCPGAADDDRRCGRSTRRRTCPAT